MLFVLIISIVLIMPNCTNRTNTLRHTLHIKTPIKKEPNISTDQHPPITIWIHGTKLLRQPLFYKTFNGKAGLRLISKIDSHEQMYKRIKALSKASPSEFPMHTNYAFCWSGKLSSSERLHVAHILYDDLQEIILEYIHIYKVRPKIKIISHSHGGGIALNLAKISAMKGDSLKISELVLLACPVQIETMDYITSNCFESIYALYSSFDMVQIIAPQNIKGIKVDNNGNEFLDKYYIPRLSARKFKPQDNLLQAKIKINKHAIGHKAFASHKFLHLLPSILEQLRTWHMDISCAYLDRELLLRIKTKHKRIG